MGGFSGLLLMVLICAGLGSLVILILYLIYRCASDIVDEAEKDNNKEE